ncbi:MAG: hypothetical protein R6W82_06540 [bacterium]
MPSSRCRFLPALMLPLLLLALPAGAGAQNSFPITDLLPLPRGSAMGGQVLSGDLLGLSVDPAGAAGGTRAEAAAGSDVFGLSWAAVAGRFRFSGHHVALSFASLSYNTQRRTALDDRLGIFGGEFTPGEAALTAATVLLDEEGLTVGAGATFLSARIENAAALGLAGAVSVRRMWERFELRAGVSNLGAVLEPFASERGTELPARVRAGGAWLTPGGEWEFSAETAWFFGEERMRAGGGVEWRPISEGAIRLGMLRGDALGTFSGSALAETGLTAGLAWSFGEWGFAYTWRPGDVLGGGHLFSLLWVPIA